jgi:hypothetical protein
VTFGPTAREQEMVRVRAELQTERLVDRREHWLSEGPIYKELLRRWYRRGPNADTHRTSRLGRSADVPISSGDFR